jgi:uncharacterized phiE125 gp8 family phage protein
MMMLERIRDAGSEPVSLSDVKRHLRILGNDQNEILQMYIASARQWVEGHIGKTLIDSDWRLRLDEFPPGNGPQRVFMPPLRTLNKISFVDADGNDVELTGAQLDDYALSQNHIFPPQETGWPDARHYAPQIAIEYTAGVGNAADVPESIKHAILLIVGAADLYREETAAGSHVTVPLDAKRLLSMYVNHRL